MLKVDRVDALSAVLIVLVGAYFFIGAQEYRMGTVVRMGPGFIPYWLGLIAMGLGAVIGLTALGRPGGLPGFSLRAAGAVLASIGLFAFLLPRFGLIVAVAVACAVSILGDQDARPLRSVLTVAAITLICWVLFIVILRLPIPAFRVSL